MSLIKTPCPLFSTGLTETCIPLWGKMFMRLFHSSRATNAQTRLRVGVVSSELSFFAPGNDERREKLPLEGFFSVIISIISNH